MKININSCSLRLLFFSFTLLFLQQTYFAQAIFDYPNGLSYADTSPIKTVFDFTPDGRKAVVLTSATNPIGAAEVKVIDPNSGYTFDSKITPGLLAFSVRVISLNEGLRVVVLARDNTQIIIYDLSENGQLTQRATTVFPTGNSVSIYDHMAFSLSGRVGFITVSVNGFFRLVSFSLDTGAILGQLNGSTGNPLDISELLYIYEDSTRRILVSGRINQLTFIDVTNPLQLQELGRITLPTAGNSGAYQMSIVFSNDGRYIFAGNGYSTLTSIDTVTRQIISSLSSTAYRVRQIKIYENGNTRYLALRSIEDDGAFKGIALIDASNPASMAVVSQINYGEMVFRINDFTFTKDGKRLYIATDTGLTGVSVPSFQTIFDAKLPVQLSIQLATFKQSGQPERIFGAWGGAPYTSPGRLFSLPNRFNKRSNFDLDGKTDIGVFRPNNGTWYYQQSTNNNISSFQFGQEGDVPVPADYDGDNKTDFAVYRPSNSVWYIFNSSTNAVSFQQLGISSDKPLPADYDGDNKADIAVFRPILNRWYLLRSSDGLLFDQKFTGGKGTPIPGDYDGDGKSDFAVFYTSGQWQISYSSTGSISQQQFGLGTDIPLSGDWDNDGKNDLAVFRPSNGTWYIQRSFAGFIAMQFGLSSDLPVPADYDGDGRTDIAVFRPSSGSWFITQSNTNTFRSEKFGLSTDTPLTSKE